MLISAIMGVRQSDWPLGKISVKMAKCILHFKAIDCVHVLIQTCFFPHWFHLLFPSPLTFIKTYVSPDNLPLEKLLADVFKQATETNYIYPFRKTIWKVTQFLLLREKLSDTRANAIKPVECEQVKLWQLQNWTFTDVVYTVHTKVNSGFQESITELKAVLILRFGSTKK